LQLPVKPSTYSLISPAGDIQDDRKSALSHISSLFGGSKHGPKGARQQKGDPKEAGIPVAVNPWEWGERYDEKVDIWQVGGTPGLA
jgi:hypothetical protein